MNLTLEQIEIIRDSTKDENAFQRVLSLFEENNCDTKTDEPSSDAILFNLDAPQTQLLVRLLDSIPVSIYVKDLQSRFLMANKYEAAVMGIKDERELIGKTDFDLDSPDAQFHFDLEQELMRTGIPIDNLEVSINDEGLAPRWLLITKSAIYDSEGKIVGLIGINRDITRQKLAEQSLENERNLLQTVINHIQDKIYVKDRDGRFILANTATLQAHQLSSGMNELLGKSDFDYMDQDRAQRLWDQEKKIMTSGDALISQELYTPAEVSKTHGQWYLVSKFPIYDESGTIQGLVGINHNITTLKLAEQRRVALELEKEKSRITANFIENASHEFRTPISIIQTCIYLIQKNPDPEKQAIYFERIRLQTERMASLIDGLLLMVRLDRKSDTTLTKIDYGHLLRSIITIFQDKISNKNLNLQLDLENTPLRGTGNTQLLDLAIAKILDNAVQYTPENGEIALRIYLKDDDIVIDIQDYGIGISEDALPYIFDRFYRSDDAYPSTGIGLGLSIAKQIIELHGGKIEVESQVGMGSLFRIMLPCSV